MKEITSKQIEETLRNDGYGLQGLLSDDYDGGCPCFWAKVKIDGKMCEMHGNCWRVSDSMEEDRQELFFVGGDKKIAQLIKKCLDKQNWYNPYKIIYE